MDTMHQLVLAATRGYDICAVERYHAERDDRRRRRRRRFRRSPT